MNTLNRTSYFSGIDSHRHPKTLVALDIDETMLYFPSGMGSQEWWDDKMSHYYSIYNCMDTADKHVVQEWYKCAATEPVEHTDKDGLVRMINEARAEGNIIIAVTARDNKNEGIASITDKQLADLGIQLDTVTIPDSPCHHQNGVFYAGEMSKGDVIVSVAKFLGVETVLFFDDVERNIVAVESALAASGIKHKCYLFECQTDTLKDTFKYMQEIVGLERLKEISKTRPLKFYWGTAPTGKPHLAYFFPILQIARMIKAGMLATVLFADRHAALDGNKTEWSMLDARTEYYTILIKEILKAAGADLSKIRFVRGSEFQRTPEYFDDLLKFSTKVSVSDAQGASVEVVKQSKNPPLSNLIYPLMQVLDEIYLDTDFEFGGVDQRKIFMLGIDRLGQIGYPTKRSYVMNPIIPSLGKSGKMSASEPNSKIDIMDTDDTIIAKSKGAFSVDRKVDGNGVMAIFKYILFQLIPTITIMRPEQYGGNITYTSYEALERDFTEGKIASIDIKDTMGPLLCSILGPIRDRVNTEFKGVLERAYPVV